MDAPHYAVRQLDLFEWQLSRDTFPQDDTPAEYVTTLRVVWAFEDLRCHPRYNIEVSLATNRWIVFIDPHDPTKLTSRSFVVRHQRRLVCHSSKVTDFQAKAVSVEQEVRWFQVTVD